MLPAKRGVLAPVFMLTLTAALAQVSTAPSADRTRALEETLRKLEGMPQKFESKIFRDAKGASLPYRLFSPAVPAGKKLPLVVFLHGGDGAGSDNLQQIVRGNLLGSSLWLLPENQAQHPCFVLAPQSPQEWEEKDLDGSILLVAGLIEKLESETGIDPSRVYVTGQSSGGYGTWNLIVHRPDLFAAAVPICGGGDPGLAPAAARLPVWAFYGLDDQVVDPAETRRMIAAMKKAGGNPKLTQYPGVGHAAWLLAYTEPDLISWLFSQSRPAAR